MRWLVLLLLIPAVTAGGIHEGLEAVTTSMYVHHLDGGAVLHPSIPNGATLSPASTAVACGEPAQWTVPFTRDVEDGSADALARVADFDTTPPRLTWFMETVQPGADAPMPALPVPWTVTAQIIGGETVMAQGQADKIAGVTVEGRHVVKAEFSMPWLDKAMTTMPADGLVLHVAATITDPADCGAAPVGLRPYGDPEHHGRILWDLYEPVRMDLFELGWSGDTLLVRVHASSPWGPLHLAPPTPPVLTTPDGAKVSPALDTLLNESAVETTWTWDAAEARNGTYRIDVAAATADGMTRVDAFKTFRIGGDAPAPVPASEPVQQTPGFALPLALLGIALGRRIS